jgi:hypothetical protein
MIEVIRGAPMSKRFRLVQTQTRRVQGRASIIGERRAHGQAIAPDRVVFRCGVFFQRAFNGPYPAQLLLQLRIARSDPLHRGVWWHL